MSPLETATDAAIASIMGGASPDPTQAALIAIARDLAHSRGQRTSTPTRYRIAYANPTGLRGLLDVTLPGPIRTDVDVESARRLIADRRGDNTIHVEAWSRYED